MRRALPGVVKIRKENDVNTVPNTVALKIRRRGRLTENMFVFRKMVGFDGIELNPEDVLDITDKKKDTQQQFQQPTQQPMHLEPKKKKRLVILNDSDDSDDVVNTTTPMKEDYDYYEFVESVDKHSDVTNNNLIVIDEDDFQVDASSDSFDPEDSNDENNPLNSYPSSETSENSNISDDYSGDYYGWDYDENTTETTEDTKHMEMW
ncbi:Uncharacterized protein QTN25_004208 [Entamoeba marina]